MRTDPITLVGSSRAIAELQREIQQAARCDAKVLIAGESGVGKEVVANLIHASSTRRGARMVTVNCAALTESLLETELFGHVRGSFTGAYRDRAGVFEIANRGTVFMDEIGETSPRMQGMLLRFLETGEIQRVGSDEPHTRVDVRVIAATNRVLLDSVASGTFREDLYYRLNIIQIVVPALRERREDIPALLAFFFESFSSKYSVRCPRLAPEALAALVQYHWPGNVRELKNVVERLVARAFDREIVPGDLPREVLAPPAEPRDSSPPAVVPPPAPATAAAGPTVADVLFDRMVTDRESFWTLVYSAFMARDLTRADLRAVVRRGLQQTSGNYRLLVELFNMPPEDYKRFLSFLRKYQCQMPFQQFRSAAAVRRSPDDPANGGNGTDRDSQFPVEV